MDRYSYDHKMSDVEAYTSVLKTFLLLVVHIIIA